ncbi:MAG: tetratricopeptide repeat protein [Verrucomicrobiales bacterium]
MLTSGLFLDASSAEPDRTLPGGALDRAEIEPYYVDELPEDLLLGEDGERKCEALLLYYRGSSLEDSEVPARLDFFKRVIELDPSNIILAMETATHCAALGQFSDAQSILEECLAQNPDKRGAYLNLSRYCERYHNDDEGLRESALKYAQQAVDKFPDDYVATEHLVRLLLERENQEEAERVLEQALEREVKDGEYWLAMGNIARDVWPMRSAENRERVVAIYENAMRAQPEDLDTVERVAEFHRMMGNTARALQLYLAVVQRSPDRLVTRENLAELFWEAGQPEKAIAGLEALVQINPEAAEVRRKLIGMYLGLKELAKAIGHCEKIVEGGTAGIEDFIRLAELQRFADRVGGALQTLRDATSIYPDSPQLSFSLGRLFLDLDRFNDAFRAFRTAEFQAEAELPDFLDEGFSFQYAMSAERAGDFDRAEDLFTKAIELVPEDAQEQKAKSLNYLGYMWLEREMNIDEAGEMIQQANELIPDNGAYLDSLGWFFYLKGEFDQAIEHLLRAEELMSEEPDSVIYEHLAQSYLAKGDREEASRYIERALELEPEKEALQSLKTSIDSEGGDEKGEETKTEP